MTISEKSPEILGNLFFLTSLKKGKLEENLDLFKLVKKKNSLSVSVLFSEIVTFLT